MKTVNKNNVCDAFHNELQQIENYIEKCNTVFKEEDLFLSFSYENAILMVYKAFEVFIERLLISCLNHDHSYFQEKHGIVLGRHINDDVCEFLITKGGFFDFKGYSGLVNTIKNTLGAEHNLVEIIKDGGFEPTINQLCAARNYAAHNSRHSKQSAKKAFGLQSISSAGSCLKRQNRFSAIVDNLKLLANHVKDNDIY